MTNKTFKTIEKDLKAFLKIDKQWDDTLAEMLKNKNLKTETKFEKAKKTYYGKGIALRNRAFNTLTTYAKLKTGLLVIITRVELSVLTFLIFNVNPTPENEAKAHNGWIKENQTVQIAIRDWKKKTYDIWKNKNNLVEKTAKTEEALSIIENTLHQLGFNKI